MRWGAAQTPFSEICGPGSLQSGTRPATADAVVPAFSAVGPEGKKKKSDSSFGRHCQGLLEKQVKANMLDTRFPSAPNDGMDPTGGPNKPKKHIQHT